RTPRYDD
ncbi:hypothetical protein D030_3698B, partial [Vibrio parahaemolyticus AQ3810]